MTSHERNQTASQIYGLVLAGGHSRRMGQDKALLPRKDGTNQLTRTCTLLANHCERVFISARTEQLPLYQSLGGPWEAIPDTFLDLGPVGGILSAMQRFPHVAWLVVAIDLPQLSDTLLRELAAHRNPHSFATAYRSQAGSFIEPLCTIYEPRTYPALLRGSVTSPRVPLTRLCPSKFLSTVDTHILEQTSEGALSNMNTPDEYQRFLNQEGTISCERN